MRRTTLLIATLATALVMASGAAVAATPAANPPKAFGARPASTAATAGDVDAVLAAMSVEDKVGQLFWVIGWGSSVGDDRPEIRAANQHLSGVDTFADLVRTYRPGGVMLLARYPLDDAVAATPTGNVDNPAQIAGLVAGLQHEALSTGAGIPLAVAADQEQGLVNRVGPPATQFPGNMALGATGSRLDTFMSAAVTGIEMRDLGISVVFAPVLDVNVNPANPVIGVRSFGENPAEVAELGVVAVQGLQWAGDAAVAKHFPGHGDTDTDSHTGLPRITHDLATLQAVDLPPFQAAVDAGVDAVMTAHIVVPALDPSGDPATLSWPILTFLLRVLMGFDGVIITDALGMAAIRQLVPDGEAALRAFLAGADVLLIPPDLRAAYDTVLGAVADGRITPERLDASVRRILTLKANRGIWPPAQPPAGVPLAPTAETAAGLGSPTHLAMADRVAADAATLLASDGVAAPIGPGQTVAVVGSSGADLESLAGVLRDAGATVEVVGTATQPTDEDRAAAVAAAERAEVVVAVTTNAWNRPAQRQLVTDVVATGRPVSLVAALAPYDLAAIPGPGTRLVVYNFAAPAMRAAGRVLLAEAPALGRLPVAVPDQGAGVSWPEGAGQDWLSRAPASRPG